MKQSPPYHIFVCTGAKSDGTEGTCHSRGSAGLLVRLRELIGLHNLSETVLLNSSDCFRYGISTCGPNLVIYPEGIWYGGLSLSDLDEIVESHLKGGKIVERLLLNNTTLPASKPS